jgi:hypothetical protein
MVRRHPDRRQSPYGLLPLSRVNSTKTAGENTTVSELIHSKKCPKDGVHLRGIHFCLTREDTFATLKPVKNNIKFLRKVNLKRLIFFLT